MAGADEDPARQFAAAMDDAAAALSEWAQRVAEATTDAFGKLDPAVRTALSAGRSAVSGDWRRCHCPCARAHPDDLGVCDGRAVMTRRLAGAPMRLCAPCAVAQGVAEMPR